jgi:LacI family transcriptional regulator
MSQNRQIGLAVDTIGSYGREVIQGVMQFCHRNPNWVIAVEPRFWVYDELPEPDQWDVDGLIVQAYSQEMMDRLKGVDFPVINVANMSAGGCDLPTVIPDDPAIGLMAAEHLLSLGLRHFGFFTDSTYEFGNLRGEAFAQRLAESGFTSIVCDTSTMDINQWLVNLPKPIGIFCCNDAWAHRLLSRTRRAGLEVPEQIAVLGVDDDELLNTVGIRPLSSISIPAARVGFEAARLLNLALEGTTPPKLTRLAPLCVVPRATTDIAQVEDAQVSAALQFIKANVSRPIQVSDVLDHLAIGRRSLERRFRDFIGRSVASEIRRAHVERAKQLLTVTSLSIEEVATAAGFASPTLLGVIFRKWVGESPTAFRQRSKCTTGGMSAPVLTTAP